MFSLTLLTSFLIYNSNSMLAMVEFGQEQRSNAALSFLRKRINVSLIKYGVPKLYEILSWEVEIWEA